MKNTVKDLIANVHAIAKNHSPNERNYAFAFGYLEGVLRSWERDAAYDPEVPFDELLARVIIDTERVLKN